MELSLLFKKITMIQKCSIKLSVQVLPLLALSVLEHHLGCTGGPREEVAVKAVLEQGHAGSLPPPS